MAKTRVVEVEGHGRIELKAGEELVEEMLHVALTDAELLAVGQEMAESMAHKRDSEARLKAATTSAKKEISAQDLVLNTLQHKLSTKKEVRAVLCIRQRDEQRMAIRTVRVDTGEVVFERPMHLSERQGVLFEPPTDPPAAPVSAPAKKPRRKAA
jgi:hypothetical protein